MCDLQWRLRDSQCVWCQTVFNSEIENVKRFIINQIGNTQRGGGGSQDVTYGFLSGPKIATFWSFSRIEIADLLADLKMSGPPFWHFPGLKLPICFQKNVKISVFEKTNPLKTSDLKNVRKIANAPCPRLVSKKTWKFAFLEKTNPLKTSDLENVRTSLFVGDPPRNANQSSQFVFRPTAGGW